MPVRHSKRQKRNISGLKNQPKPIPEPSSTESPVVEPTSTIQEQLSLDPEDTAENADEDLGLRCPDSLKPLWRADDDDEGCMQAGEELEDGWELREENLYIKLMTLAIDNGDDPRDEDWVPRGLRRKKQGEKGYFHCNTS
jgi:hypothetical protein